MHHLAHKFHDVLQLKEGGYTDVSDVKILEFVNSSCVDVSFSVPLCICVNICDQIKVSGTILVLIQNLDSNDVLMQFCNLFMQNASTKSLFSIVNRILDECVERKNGDVPHVGQCFY